MDYKKTASQWLESQYFDETTKAEILTISDDEELKDRFYQELSFGTAGLRGIMGAGTNRMNIYTVRKATYGLFNYLDTYKDHDSNLSVVIGYDNRNNSKLYALEAALVLCASNVKVYLFETLVPTPELSYAVIALKCNSGIMITASHNTKEYNGYKAYSSYGGQYIPEEADKIKLQIDKINDYGKIPNMDEIEALEKNLLEYIGVKIHEEYYKAVSKQSLIDDDTIKNNLSVVYTPLHGTGNKAVRTVLKNNGFKNIAVVLEQELPDGDFSTVISPNPENKDSMTLAVSKAELLKADLVMATDPDADRIGISVLHNDEYHFLSGNQTGALLLNFILEQKESNHTLNADTVIIKTIVTSEIGRRIANSYNVKMIDTLTGFKYIGALITNFEKNRSLDFIFGYEESYGYLVGKHARDKDAVVTALLICEMCAFYKNMDITLIDKLDMIYDRFGCYTDQTKSYTFEGIEGQEKMSRIIEEFRNNSETLFEDDFIVIDYNEGISDLPKANVLKFLFHDDSWIAIRPSGTEPKIKVYYSIRGCDMNQSLQRFKILQTIVETFINI